MAQSYFSLSSSLCLNQRHTNHQTHNQLPLPTGTTNLNPRHKPTASTNLNPQSQPTATTTNPPPTSTHDTTNHGTTETHQATQLPTAVRPSDIHQDHRDPPIPIKQTSTSSQTHHCRTHNPLTVINNPI